jgi:hypothetical protein
MADMAAIVGMEDMANDCLDSGVVLSRVQLGRARQDQQQRDYLYAVLAPGKLASASFQGLVHFDIGVFNYRAV